MFIKEITLEGYQRILYGTVESITLTFTSALQLILGTNGCGKSSLVYEFSPLPANPANYTKGGLKRVVLTHNDSDYVLETRINAGAKHSFIKDGVELNNGQTGAVQKELVKQHFSYTQEIHDLMTGRLKFTTMAPIKRREWLTLLCQTDVSYGLRVFKAAATEARNVTGALSKNEERLGIETSKLLDKESLETLNAKIVALGTELQSLFTVYRNDLPDDYVIEAEFLSLQTELESIARRILDTPHFSLGDHGDFQTLLQQSQLLENELFTNTKLLQSHRDDLDTLNTLLDRLVDPSHANVEQFYKQRDTLRKQLEEIRAVSVVWRFTNDDSLASKLAIAVNAENEINAALLQLKPNPDRARFSQQGFQDAQTKLADLSLKIDRTRNRLSHIEHQLEQISSTAETECPQCNYKWKLGVDVTTVPKLKSAQQTGLAELAKLQTEHDQTATYLRELDEWRESYRYYTSIKSTYGALKEFWAHLDESTVLYDNPVMANGLIRGYIHDLTYAVSEVDCVKELDIIETTLARLASMAKMEGVALSEQAAVLEQRIETLVAMQRQTEARLKELRQLTESVTDVYSGYDRLAERWARFQDVLLQLGLSRVNGVLREAIQERQSQLALAEQTKLETHGTTEIIKHIQSQQDSLKEDKEAYKLLLDALNPEDGVIADQLIGFVRCFVEQLNTIIGSIWTHTLQIQPCGVEEDELNYKFPLVVKDGRNPNPDISKGSTGECQVIDYAFVLLALFYLGLDDIPVTLDELGSAFDDTHRPRVIEHVKSLLETKRVPQVFLISHYASTHGSLVNAEVCVLDTTNIVVPQSYNEHVVMA